LANPAEVAAWHRTPVVRSSDRNLLARAIQSLAAGFIADAAHNTADAAHNTTAAASSTRLVGQTLATTAWRVANHGCLP